MRNDDDDHGSMEGLNDVNDHGVNDHWVGANDEQSQAALLLSSLLKTILHVSEGRPGSSFAILFYT
jgi:hypothetical protein